MFRRLAIVLAASAVALLAIPALSSAHTAKSAALTVPNGFIGTVVGSPLFPNPASSSVLGSQLDLMVKSGVESIHVPFYWDAAQPYRSFSDVPSSETNPLVNDNGVPTDYTGTDQLVAAAAARGLTIMPEILSAPSWDGKSGKHSPFRVPRTTAPYANYLKGLVGRYGPGGTFWSQNPQLTPDPITEWQVWNEPNLRSFWDESNWPKTYGTLLKASDAAVKSVDPNAKVVLGGLTNYSWDVLNTFYHAGYRKYFDIAAVHPYTKNPGGVITILQKFRAVMNQNGDRRKPIVADELGWPSSLGQTNQNFTLDFGTTEAGQASKISKLMKLLAHDRRGLRLIGFDYYTWVSEPKHNGNVFTFAGLESYTNGQFTAKPALKAFAIAALALESCRTKGATATSCVSP